MKTEIGSCHYVISTLHLWQWRESYEWKTKKDENVTSVGLYFNIELIFRFSSLIQYLTYRNYCYPCFLLSRSWIKGNLSDPELLNLFYSLNIYRRVDYVSSRIFLTSTKSVSCLSRNSRLWLKKKYEIEVTDLMSSSIFLKSTYYQNIWTFGKTLESTLFKK